MANEVKFVKTTLENYKKRIPTQDDSNNIYFLTDLQEIIIGNLKFSNAFVTVDNTHPLPAEGRTGCFYLDKRNNSFSIKVWVDDTTGYMNLPIADTSYIKSLSRVDQTVIGTKGTGDTDTVSLDTSLSTADIDSLFPSDEDEED